MAGILLKVMRSSPAERAVAGAEIGLYAGALMSAIPLVTAVVFGRPFDPIAFTVGMLRAVFFGEVLDGLRTTLPLLAVAYWFGGTISGALGALMLPLARRGAVFGVIMGTAAIFPFHLSVAIALLPISLWTPATLIALVAMSVALGGIGGFRIYEDLGLELRSTRLSGHSD
jgi:hypothetical protein